ncbi:bifunctional methylenetetrahydrofolate dehydrogenase/methenyltetrahydrofolate cyclohydrolase FolD [Bosea sp. NPDC055353]
MKGTAAHRIDGKAFASVVSAQVAKSTAELQQHHGITPGLAVVLVGHDPASEVYVRNKARQTIAAGMASFEHRLDAGVSQREISALIAQLNADKRVHGILVQLPLPDHIDAQTILSAIDPAKDVDGFHPLNVGLMAAGQKPLVPCTPLGCLMLLRAHHGDLSGKHAVVIGRSNIVGKPMAQLLLRSNCTVTIAHSRSANLPELCRQADILIAAVGRPEMVKADWVKPGATVIDVGINRVTSGEDKPRLVGDVDFAAVSQVAGAVTPVPGGVGPMTIACLLANTLNACRRSLGLPEQAELTP